MPQLWLSEKQAEQVLDEFRNVLRETVSEFIWRAQDELDRRRREAAHQAQQEQHRQEERTFRGGAAARAQADAVALLQERANMQAAVATNEPILHRSRVTTFNRALQHMQNARRAALHAVNNSVTAKDEPGMRLRMNEFDTALANMKQWAQKVNAAAADPRNSSFGLERIPDGLLDEEEIQERYLRDKLNRWRALF